ncbi:MAG TPA: apolipoprotein acyltransferase, partial [Methylocella sp.]|nr:apolipoprotein acyltransferase [Methylocella sp.]
MASSNKAQDPAAAALLAIEEALNLRAAGQNDEAGEAPATPLNSSAEKPKGRLPGDRNNAAPRSEPPRRSRDTARTPEPALTAIDEDRLFGPARANSTQGGEEGQAPEPSSAATPPILPANDDRQSAGEILRAFQTRYNRSPAVFAAGCSALWGILTLIYFIANRTALFNGSSGSVLPKLTLAFMTIAGPVIFFLVTAALLRRGQEMRLAARSMTEVALRLAEPETIATGQMVTLSQAIRREVASMGDGIERALARASELETLVRSEVSNLERSYSDNERR